jgi:hypothetical protein
MRRVRRPRSVVLTILLASIFLRGTADAQQPEPPQPAHVHPVAVERPQKTWAWSWDASVFFGWNYQWRKFTDFQRVESQNWLMGAGERKLGAGALRLHTMLSFEPFTMQPLGSPQVFQTGETYANAPLIDYQHPHDLFMDLGATFVRPLRAVKVCAEVSAVGAPALGPTPFMHRPSAEDNPTVPLSHHQMDATHITHGVVTGGLTKGEITFDASVFRGAEPDENRKDIELGALDSYSGRVTWKRGPWKAQMSAGHLTTPEWVEPFNDVTRLTASVEYASADGRLATLLSWGENREVHGILDAYLFEAKLRAGRRQSWYVRAELATKDILGAGGRHPRGFTHFHPLSRVGGFTLGYLVDLLDGPAGRLGIGGDATVYRVPPNLLDNYGSPASFHVFLRYRPNRTMSHTAH